jgi:actin related protein 2/3 complex subunit 5
MSIIQQHTSATLGDGWRRINIDALNEDSSVNFDTSTLVPPQPEISEAEAKQLAGQIRQLLRGGDAAGALRGCLDSPVYNGTDAAKVRRGNGPGAWKIDGVPGMLTDRRQEAHLHTIIEVLQSIKASEMTPLLKSIYGSEGGSEALDVLMKYMYEPNHRLAANKHTCYTC